MTTFKHFHKKPTIKGWVMSLLILLFFKPSHTIGQPTGEVLQGTKAIVWLMGDQGAPAFHTLEFQNKLELDKLYRTPFLVLPRHSDPIGVKDVVDAMRMEADPSCTDHDNLPVINTFFLEPGHQVHLFIDAGVSGGKKIYLFTAPYGAALHPDKSTGLPSFPDPLLEELSTSCLPIQLDRKVQFPGQDAIQIEVRASGNCQ